LQSFGEAVAQKFERPESTALPTLNSAEAGNATPKTAFRSLELAVPTHSSQPTERNAAIPQPAQRPHRVDQ
jgi:hypothetical protein